MHVGVTVLRRSLSKVTMPMTMPIGWNYHDIEETRLATAKPYDADDDSRNRKSC